MRMLTVAQAAERLGLRPATIRAWIFRREHLDFVKVGRSVRISEKAVERFIHTNTVCTLAKSDRKAGDRGFVHAPEHK